MWVIEKVVKKGDYLYAVVKDHPSAIKYGYVLQHRVVMENKIGRLLKPTEVVHHKDENKHNNHIDNLELLTNSEHSRKHASIGRTFLEFICPLCGKKFSREKKSIHVDNPKCSRSCNGKVSRSLQLNLIKDQK